MSGFLDFGRTGPSKKRLGLFNVPGFNSWLGKPKREIKVSL